MGDSKFMLANFLLINYSNNGQIVSEYEEEISHLRKTSMITCEYFKNEVIKRLITLFIKSDGLVSSMMYGFITSLQEETEGKSIFTQNKLIETILNLFPLTYDTFITVRYKER